MADFTVRTLEPERHRDAAELFRASLHLPPLKDEEWDRLQHGYLPGSTLGALDPALIGTTRSMDAECAVPGGARVPMAAVTGVGVRADRVRRGVLTELMRVQLSELAERGIVVAMLHATEGPIYGRFGYGVATLGKNVTVDRRRARLHPDAPAGGEIELLDLDTALRRLPEIFEELGAHRPGMMNRPSSWWPAFEVFAGRSDSPVMTAVQHGPDGVDGFASYNVAREAGGASAVLRVNGVHVANEAALAGLWRFLLSVDLTDEIHAWARPVDEPVAALFTDPRVCKVDGSGDESWLRLVDVPAALAARGYQGERVVLEVVDPLLGNNSGRYVVSGDGASRTDEPAELRLGVDVLAMLYLGAWRASALAATGRIEVLDPGAPARADELFRTRVAAWCGTFF